MYYYRMTEIIDGIFIGPYSAASMEENLEAENISHIVSAHEMHSDPFKKHKVQRKYLKINICDIPGANIYKHFMESNDFIHDCKLNNGRVLIHCQMGISRSVTLTCIYLMTLTNMTFDDVLKAVRANRPPASPNDGFRSQIVKFEKNDMQNERDRMEKKFGSLTELGNKYKELLNALLQKSV